MVTCETVTNMCRESSFHSVQLLGHNRTSKSMKVPITLQKQVIWQREQRWRSSPFLAGSLHFEQTLYTLLTSSSLSSLSMVSRNSQRIAWSFNRSGSAAGLGVGFSEDTRSLLLPQARLVFSSSFTHTELSEYCWSSSGEAKSGFPADFFSRNRACLFLERANAEGDLFFFWRHLLTGFTVVRPVPCCRPWFCWGFWREVCNWQLMRIYPDSALSFHNNRLSSSFSSLFRTSMIDLGITLANPSIINIQ